MTPRLDLSPPAPGTNVTSRTWRSSVARLSVELGVVAVGVLIALWADGWVTEQRERSIERSRIDALRDNVVATRERLRVAQAEARSAREALTLIAYWQDVDELNGNPGVVVSGLLFGSVFTPEMNVYADLKSSGDLALLRSAELRQALALMDATLEQLALRQSDLAMVQQLNFDPFLIRELSLAGSLGPLLGLEGLPTDDAAPTLDLRILRNLALFKVDMVSLLLDTYAEALDVLDSVEEAMIGGGDQAGKENSGDSGAGEGGGERRGAGPFPTDPGRTPPSSPRERS